MLRGLFAFILLLAIPLSAKAADTLPQWQINTAKSSLTFSGTQQGAPFDGKFGDFSGDIFFDPAKPETGHATIKVIMKSADTSSPDRDQYIGQDAWFAADKFPTATYDITSFEKISNDQYVAHGKMTIRDVSMPLNLPFTLKIDQSTARADGETTINRLDYGIGQGEWKDTSMVANAVKVKVSVTAIRK